MKKYEETRPSGFIRRLGENRIIFVARVSLLFFTWIVLSAIISLLLVTWEYSASKILGSQKKASHEL